MESIEDTHGGKNTDCNSDGQSNYRWRIALRRVHGDIDPQDQDDQENAERRVYLMNGFSFLGRIVGQLWSEKAAATEL